MTRRGRRGDQNGGDGANLFLSKIGRRFCETAAEKVPLWRGLIQNKGVGARAFTKGHFSGAVFSKRNSQRLHPFPCPPPPYSPPRRWFTGGGRYPAGYFSNRKSPPRFRIYPFGPGEVWKRTEPFGWRFFFKLKYFYLRNLPVTKNFVTLKCSTNRHSSS